MSGLGHSRAQHQHVELGGRRDGTLLALRAHVVADIGAYAGGIGLANNTGALLPGVYHIPAASWTNELLVTNTVPIVAYRGAGRPEAAALLERAVDLFAAEVGLDPVEVRRRNLVRADEMPYTSATGLVYDSGDYDAALEHVLGTVAYDELRAEQAQRRTRGDRTLLGIGTAVFLDRTAGIAGTEYGAVEVLADGSALVATGATPYGQGHETTFAMLVSDRLGLPLDRITVVHGDTDVVPRGAVTGGSRSVQRAGSAIVEAADAVVELGRAIAAELLEAAEADIVIDRSGGGSLHVAGSPGVSVSWADVARTRNPAIP
jgi:CO/xanthine dehydrogenase Mo-binding subunit